MNFNKIVVFDFESDSTNPHTCNPVQLSAIIINPRTLDIIPNSEFNSFMRPINIDNEDYVDKNKSTIDWHAKVRNCKSDDIINLWKNAPLQKDVFEDFKEYLLRYHTRTTRKNKFSAPIAAGHNIIKFDIPIMERLSKTYNAIDKEGTSILFNPRDRIDTMFLLFIYFENFDEPKSYSMDVLRDYLGMDKEGGHDALKDVQDTSELIIRFMRLTRGTADRTKFKGSFSKNKKK